MSTSNVHHWKTIIQETHIDLFGHVNNAAYLELFEQARWDLISQNGFGINEIIKHQVGPTILEINIKYLKELRAREVIIITVESVEHGRKVGKLKQQMLRENGEVAAEALITYGLFDMKSRRLIEPTPEWKKAIGLNE
jgi:YbgC/YbaW family acyl-CoA thioester hydrolase